MTSVEVLTTRREIWVQLLSSRSSRYLQEKGHRGCSMDFPSDIRIFKGSTEEIENQMRGRQVRDYPHWHAEDLHFIVKPFLVSRDSVLMILRISSDTGFFLCRHKQRSRLLVDNLGRVSNDTDVDEE